MVSQIVAELAPTGVLRAGINMSNFLLVTGKSASGDPQGVSPDMAAEIARRLGVPVAYVQFERPSKLADAAGTNTWDIGLIGAEPQRAEKITFTAAYCEIEATYLVPNGSPISNYCRRRSRRACALRCGAAPLTISGWSATSSRPQFCGRTVPTAPSTNLSPKIWKPTRRLRPQLLTDVEKLPAADPAGQLHDGATGDRHREAEYRRRRVLE